MPPRLSAVERIRAQIDELFASDQELGQVLEQVARLSVRLVGAERRRVHPAHPAGGMMPMWNKRRSRKRPARQCQHGKTRVRLPNG